MQAERSLAELTRDLAANAGDLFRNELRLARAEAIDSVKDMGGGIVRAAVGLLLAGAAVTLGLFALAFALSQLVPLWAAALISALIGGAVAYALMRSGLKAISVDRIALPRTAGQIARDVSAIKEKVTS
jgi:hypothetical protein